MPFRSSFVPHSFPELHSFSEGVSEGGRHPRAKEGSLECIARASHGRSHLRSGGFAQQLDLLTVRFTYHGVRERRDLARLYRSILGSMRHLLSLFCAVYRK